MATVEKINPRPEFLKGIFNDQAYQIPPFQRPYSWDREQIEKIWGDLNEISLETNERVHFMGTLILKANGSNNFDIIDGQQRLTTFVILFNCINKKLSELEKKPGIKITKLDKTKNMLNRLIFNSDIKPVLNNEYIELAFDSLSALPANGLAKKNVRKMRIAIDLLNDKLKDYDLADLEKLLNILRNQVQFVVIEIHEEVDGITLFQTLNDRGMRLSYGDLVKSNILQKIYKTDRSAVDDYLETWDHILDNIGDADAGKFIRHYCIANEDFSKSTLQGIYASIKQNIQQDDEFPQQFSDNLETFSEYYAQLLEPSNKDIFGVLFEELDKLNAERCYPLILSVMNNVKDEKNKEKIIKKTISLTFRYSTILNKDAKNLEVVYSKCAKELRKNKENGVKKVLDALDAEMPDDNEYHAGFMSKEDIKHNIAGYIFTKIENYLDDNSKKTLGSAVHDVEDIFPVNCEKWRRTTDYASAEISALEEKQTRLGNLALMLLGDNRKMKNEIFEKKKVYYKKSKLKFTESLAACERWTASEIDRRQQKIYEYSLKIWN